MSAEEVARTWAEDLLLENLADELAARLVGSFLDLTPADIEGIVRAGAEGTAAPPMGATAVGAPSLPPDFMPPPPPAAPSANTSEPLSELSLITRFIHWVVGCPLLGISAGGPELTADKGNSRWRPRFKLPMLGSSSASTASARARSSEKAIEALSAAVQLKSLLDKTRVASGRQTIRELPMHRSLAIGIRLRCSTARLERYADHLESDTPLPQTTVTDASALLARAERAQRQAQPMIQVAVHAGVGGDTAMGAAAGDEAIATAAGGAASAQVPQVPQVAVPVAVPTCAPSTVNPSPSVPSEASSQEQAAHEKRSRQLRRQMMILVKRLASELGGSVDSLFDQVTAAPTVAALPPRLQQLLRIARQLSYYFVTKKLTPALAKKCLRLLGLVPLKVIVSLLSRGNNATRVLRSLVGLLLTHPPGSGGSLLQHVFAISLDLSAQEKELQRLLTPLPPTTRHSLEWLLEHSGEEPAMCAGSDEALSSHLLQAGEALGASDALSREWAGETRELSVAVRKALHVALALRGGRDIHTIMGQPAFEQILTNLMPRLQEPILRIALKGDVQQLLRAGLPKLEVLLKTTLNRELPDDQRAVAIALAVRDLFAAVYAYVHSVTCASGKGSEFHVLLQWLLTSWQSTQKHLDMDLLIQDSTRRAPPSEAAGSSRAHAAQPTAGSAGGSAAAASTADEWEHVLAKVHLARAFGKDHGRIDAEEVSALLNGMVKQMGL